MTSEEKISLLAEDVFDVELSELTPDTVLEESDFWDSMSKLSLTSVFDGTFKKVLNGEDIKKFKTVQDILDAMN
ncbi:MAG: acyl carrier protein [Treponema sp.]|nr:acyl carrier protein [Treponema sp.]